MKIHIFNHFLYEHPYIQLFLIENQYIQLFLCENPLSGNYGQNVELVGDCYPSITMPDGNRWFTQNLAQTVYNDGTPILAIETNANNWDGSVDPTINFGTGANGSVLAIALRPDYKMILGGGFTVFNSEPKEHIVQVHGGIIRTPGRLEFDFPEYVVNEKGTNATVRVVRTGGLIGNISANFSTLEGNDINSAIGGVDYQPILTRLDFPEGEAIQNLTIEILDDIESSRRELGPPDENDPFDPWGGDP